MERWVNKTAVVTGAKGGIGSAIICSLVEKGLKVVGLDKISEGTLGSTTKECDKLQYKHCNVSDVKDVEETFKWIKQTLGGIDILVNCAGVVYHGTITDVGPNQLAVEELMQQIDVNVKSVVLCSRQAASSMHQRVQGHIININSIIGHSVSNQPIFNTYCASKHAITALTQTLRVEFSAFNANIKTSSVSPSLVRTRMADMERMPELAAAVARAPALQPQDVADAILYLLSTPPHVNVEELTISPVGDTRL